MLRWYNISKQVRVMISTEDWNFIKKHRYKKKVPKSSLDDKEQPIIDMLVKKSVFGRYTQGTETFYLFNK